MPKAPKLKASTSARGPIKKDPKASHLYTDDNPATTLHGTGFKDAATARHTLILVSKRSLTYQFQTINTMLHRALGHPHKTNGILAAIEILQAWVTDYPIKKASMRQFKLLKKEVVEKWLKVVEEHNEDLEATSSDFVDTDFAKVYISMPPRKRLANTLLDDSRPQGPDWEVQRYDTLSTLVPSDILSSDASKATLWKKSKTPSTEHLKWIMWAYSPAKEKDLS